jgi:hypothetical protein
MARGEKYQPELVVNLLRQIRDGSFDRFVGIVVNLQPLMRASILAISRSPHIRINVLHATEGTDNARMR